MDAETLRYFFSTVAQSMAALIAIGGVFTVFGIQIAYKRLEDAYDSFRAYAKSLKPVDACLNKDVEHYILSLAREYLKNSKNEESLLVCRSVAPFFVQQ
ncbi:MAG: hypothetical protein EOM73_07525 [Bacteroidia bacterium]|nr:hypothetical protein [Bacteroidia bacterium]